MNVIDGESSKARGERELLSGLNVVAVLLQNRDCKRQMDVVDMVRSNLVFPLKRTCANTESIGRKAAFNVAIGVNEIIHRRNSKIAQANAARRVKEKSGEVLAFIHILYSF